jgi:superfamily II DNA or RNA helicase
MGDEIGWFLPKYPNVFKKREDLLNPYDENFAQAIFRKKEFFDQRATGEIVERPSQPGDLLKHQKLIARFVSSNTQYDELLLLHGMGTGKTCAAAGAIEEIRETNKGFKGALVFAKGSKMLNNFREELATKCTSGRYIPDSDEEEDAGITQKQIEYRKMLRRNKLISQFYRLDTFKMFAKEISQKTPVQIKEEFSNRVIVIDEVHNLRQKSGNIKTSSYGAFWRFLHAVEGCKVILLSGTPMKDGVGEIASIMNLILPIGRQLPSPDEFVSKYFDQSASGIESSNADDEKVPNFVDPKADQVSDLKDHFKGRVSYYRSHPDVSEVFEGQPIDGLKHISVVQDLMSDHQTAGYKKALSEDFRTPKKGEKKTGVYTYTVQATLFVFPDGTFGSAGFNQPRYLKGSSSGIVKKKDVKIISTYTLGDSLRIAISGNTEEMLGKLAIYSSMYAATMRQLITAHANGKSSFVYIDLLSGSGAHLFVALLKHFGFSRAIGQVTTKERRFAIITGNTKDTESKKILQSFNDPSNLHGEYISLIVGSEALSEGFSLMNVQTETILTPAWNYSATAQAIARGVRFGSHQALVDEAIAKGVAPNLKVEIYQRVATPRDPNLMSIDMRRYRFSEVKDINIKKVERLIQESAFDCALNYRNNRVYDHDGERLCDYLGCEYTCDGISPEFIRSVEDGAPGTLDYSTYQLYYDKEVVEKIVQSIGRLFRTSFILDFETLRDTVSQDVQLNEFELLTAVRKIVGEDIVILNRFGISSYLREDEDQYFLVDSLTVFGNAPTEYYTSHPNLAAAPTFEQILRDMELTSHWRIRRACESKSEAEFNVNVTVLPPDIQEVILEGSILARKLGLTVRTDFRDLILNQFTSLFREIDGVWVSGLWYSHGGPLRCLIDNDWKDCDEKFVQAWTQGKAQQIANLTDKRTNPYEHYGMYSFKDGEEVFCIRDVTDDEIRTNKRAKNKGRVCDSWLVPNLLRLIIDYLKIKPPDTWNADYTTEDLWNMIGSKYKKPPLENTSRDLARRAAYWTTNKTVKSRPQMCKAIRLFFKNHNPTLLIEDEACGQS